MLILVILLIMSVGSGESAAYQKTNVGANCFRSSNCTGAKILTINAPPATCTKFLKGSQMINCTKTNGYDWAIYSDHECKTLIQFQKGKCIVFQHEGKPASCDFHGC